MFWSHLDGACFNEFVRHFGRANEGLNILVMDNASAHKSKEIDWPENVLPVYLPAYSPELNPVERLWQDLKAKLDAWYHTMDDLLEDVDWYIELLDDHFVHSLTCFPYIRNLIFHS